MRIVCCALLGYHTSACIKAHILDIGEHIGEHISEHIGEHRHR